MEKLTHELGRTRVLRIPSVRQDQIVSADQSQVPVWHLLVDYDLGARDIQDAALHQGSVYIVQPHCSAIGATYAAKLQSISLRLSQRHIAEPLGRVPHHLEKG